MKPMARDRDGEKQQPSWNCGVEGPTKDEAVNALRDRQRRNFSQHFFSQGYRCCPQATSSADHPVTTMPIVQDNPSTGYLGNVTHARIAITLLASYWPFDGLIQFFAAKFFQGRPFEERRLKTSCGLNSTGAEMSDAEWNSVYSLSWYVC